MFYNVVFRLWTNDNKSIGQFKKQRKIEKIIQIQIPSNHVYIIKDIRTNFHLYLNIFS